MSRLPLQFAARDIKFRIPYNIYGELDVDPNTQGQQFQDAAFLISIDKPFEHHRWNIHLTALDEDGAILEPQPTTLGKRVKLSIMDLSKNESQTKAATPVEAFLAANTDSWELEEPYTLVRAEGYQVTANAGAFPTVCVNDADVGDTCTSVVAAVTSVRIGINLQGYLLIVAPPTENR